MLKIYGSMLCPDCVACCDDLTRANVKFEFKDFADNLMNLKEFLAIRDQSELFDNARRNGNIGIPCIVDEQGSVTLSWEKYVSQGEA